MSDDANEKKAENVVVTVEKMEVDSPEAPKETEPEDWWARLMPKSEKPKEQPPPPPPKCEALQHYDKAHVYPLPRDRFEKKFYFGSVKVTNTTEKNTNLARVDIYDHLTSHYSTFFIDDGLYDVQFCEGRQEFYLSGMKQTVYCYFYVAYDDHLCEDFLIIRRQYSRDESGNWSFIPQLLDNTITRGRIPEDPEYTSIDKVTEPHFDKCRNAPVLVTTMTDNVVYVINSFLEREGCSVFYNNEHIADLESKVVLMDSGFAHSLLLTESNQLYSIGSGLYGQLGHGNMAEKEKEPRLVEYFESVKVMDIAAGPFQSVAICVNGEACAFGWNTVGQLGPELPIGEIVTSPMPMMPLEDKNAYVSVFVVDGYVALKTLKGDIVNLPLKKENNEKEKEKKQEEEKNENGKEEENKMENGDDES